MLANASDRIEFIIFLIMDWLFASGCPPPRLSTTQLPSATDSQCFCPTGTLTPLLVRTFRRTEGRPPSSDYPAKITRFVKQRAHCGLSRELLNSRFASV